MSAPQGRQRPGANRLLTVLPPSSRERLWALGRPMRLEFKTILMHQGDRVEHIYFPDSGVVSLVVLMEDGRGVEVASVGFEGMVGAEVVLGEELSPYEATVQVDGEALQVPAGALRATLDEDRALRDILLRYVQVQLLQASRSAACNRLHELEERLARWLLHIHDWVGEDRLRLTHDFLAEMLGVRRATVTVTAGALQRAGLISCRRGEITILDRQGLEEIACEDYAAIRDAFERVLVSASTAAGGASRH